MGPGLLRLLKGASRFVPNAGRTVVRQAPTAPSVTRTVQAAQPFADEVTEIATVAAPKVPKPIVPKLQAPKIQTFPRVASTLNGMVTKFKSPADFESHMFKNFSVRGSEGVKNAQTIYKHMSDTVGHTRKGFVQDYHKLSLQKQIGLNATLGAVEGGAWSAYQGGDMQDIIKDAALGATLAGGITGAPAAARATKKAYSADPYIGKGANAQAGYMATPDSVNFNKYVKQGKPVIEFNDGLKGVEISDKKMKVKPQGVQQLLESLVTGKAALLDDVLDHKQQKGDYPILYSREGTGMLKVRLDFGDNTTRGSLSTDDGIITVNPAALGNTPEGVAKSLQSEQGRRILAHEISHAIDNYSGVKGSNPFDVQNALRMEQGRVPTEMDVYQAYNQTPSEQRALIQEDRTNMSQRQIDRNPIVTRASLEAKASGGEVAAMRYNPQPKGKDGKFVKSAEKVYRVHALDDVDAERMAFLKSKGYSSIADGSRTIDLISGKEVRAVKKLDNLNPTGGLHVKYDPQSRMKMPLGDNITTLDKTMGKSPDEMITVYRGAPKNQKTINPGDFITTNKELAKSYTGDGNVIESKVPLKHILDDKTEPLGEEYLYRPSKNKPIAALKNPEDKSVANGSLYDPPKINRMNGAPIKPPEKQRGFVTSVKQSDEVTDQAKALTNETYIPKSNQVLTANAAKYAEGDIKVAIDKAHDDLAVEMGKINDQTVANVIETAKKADASGDFKSASDLYDSLAEHLTESGRAVQAASLLSRRTPEGLMFSAQKELKKAGVSLEGALQKKLQDAKARVAATAEGSPERDRTVQEFMQIVKKNIPSDRIDKFLGAWKAGLLTGVKTFTGAPTSNLVFGGLKKVADAPAAGIDKGISLITGKRAKTFTMKGTGSGMADGAEHAHKYWKTGIDESQDNALKWEQGQLNFKTKALDAYVNGVFKAMGVVDKPFRYSALKNSLADMGKADGLNKGLRGKELRAHMDNFMNNPSKEALERATEEGAKAVLANDTALSKVVAGARRNLENQNDPLIKGGGKLAIGITAPFTKVPSAFISRTMDFTPVGAVREVTEQIVKGKFDQRKLSQALGEATTGTAIVYLGANLASNDLLSGDYPREKQEQERWKAEGITANSVKLGDTWVSLNYLGPLGMLFGTGKKITDALEEGNNPVTSSIAGLYSGALNQSFLQGMNSAVEALKSPETKAEVYARNLLSSIIPSLSRDAAEFGDDMQREVNSIGDAFKARIPGMRNDLMVKQDAFGNDLEKRSGDVSTAINPAKPSDSLSTELTNELDRLKKQGESIFPTQDKTLRVGEETIKFTPEQAHKWNKTTGQQLQDTWNEIIKTEDYKAMSADKQKEVLEAAMKDVNAVNKVKFLREIDKGALADKVEENLSKRQVAMMSEKIDVGEYLIEKGTKNPKREYEVALKTYNRDKHKMTSIERYKKEKELTSMEVKSHYSKEILDLYGMNKTDLINFFEENPDKEGLFDEVQKLDSTLAEKMGSKRKFAWGLGSKPKKGRKAKVAKVKVVKPRLAKLSTPKVVKAKTTVKSSTPRYARIQNRTSTAGKTFKVIA